MRVPFRQGIVANVVPSTFTTGTSDLSGFYVNLAVPNPNFPPTFHFADGDHNYLYAFRIARPDAWGPFLPGITKYLWVDISTATGAVSFGATALDLIVSAVAPASPANDQHWFDTLNNQMKVWNSTANQWVRKVRVFAGELFLGVVPPLSMSINATLPQQNAGYYLDTQIGNQTPNTAGFILYSQNGSALQRADGTFITTADTLIAEGVTESAPIAFSTNTLSAIADTTIPAFSMVTFDAFGHVTLMGPADTNQKVYGIVVEDANPDETVTVITSGIVNNSNWSWPTVNAALFCDTNGVLTTTRPPAAPDPVAAVVDEQSIYLLAADITLTSETLQDHIDNFDVHLTTLQNAFLDALNLPTLTAADLNQLAGLDLDATYQPLDATLTGLAALAGPTGIVVETAANTFTNRSLTSTGGTITVTNPAGIAGNPNVDLPNVGSPIADLFVRVTTDAQGRVSSSNAVVASDITTLVDAFYINTSGDTMAGNLAMAGFKVTGLGAGTVSGDALHFGQIGAQIQAWDADLDAVAAIAAGNGFVQRTAGVWSAAALTGAQVNTALGYTAADAARNINTTVGDLTGGGNLTADRTLSLATTAVTAGSYGSASAVGTFTVDTKGRLTAAATTPISITASQVSDFATAVNTEVAEPANQIVYGTGTDIDSASTLTYNSTSGDFAVNQGFAAVAAPGNITILGADGTLANDGGDVYIQGGNSVTGGGGDITLAAGTGGTTGVIQLAAGFTLQVGPDLQISGDPGTSGDIMMSTGLGTPPAWSTVTTTTTQAVPAATGPYAAQSVTEFGPFGTPAGVLLGSPYITGSTLEPSLVVTLHGDTTNWFVRVTNPTAAPVASNANDINIVFKTLV